MKVDAAIIGAGPAGGMAALKLAGTGLKVVLLEKESLPREKPCGGCIPADALAGLGLDFRQTVENRVTEVRYFNDFRMEKTHRISAPLLMVSRSRFDFELICRAAENGKTDLAVRDGFPIEEVEETPEAVRLRGKGGERIFARAVVVADGANSEAARQVGLFQPRAAAFALAATAEIPASLFDEIKSAAIFNISCLAGGYGWIFPKAGYINCGIGALRPKKGLSAAFDDFIKASFPGSKIRIISKRGHPLPLFDGQRKLATRRLCLVGDAASLVEPVMGEGIRYALESGAIAADAILGRISEKGKIAGKEKADGARGGLLGHDRTIAARIGNRLGPVSRFALPLFLAHPDFFYRKFFYEGVDYRAACQGLAMKMAGSLHRSRVPE